MAGPTLIQIKRSILTGSTPSLANGELAFTANGDVLFIGSNAVTIPIAGKRTPGVLTANQDICTNSISHIDQIKIGNTIANMVLSATGILLSNTDGEGNTIVLTTPNNTEKAGQYYLKADGSWSTVTAGSATPAGANTQLQFNDSGVTGATAGFTFAKDTNNVVIANTLTVGANFIANGLGAYHSALVNSALFTTSGFRANTIGVYPTSNTVGQLFGNTISRWEITANAISLTGIATLAGQVANSLGFYPNSNTVGQLLGNTISRWDIFTTGQTTNSLGIYPISNTAGQLFGNSISRWDLFTTGQSTNSTGLYPISNTVGQKSGNTISRWEIFANTLDITSTVTANGGLGGAGQVLTSNLTGGVYWAVGGGGALSALTDVTISGIANNDLIVYDNTASKWKNKPAGNGFTFAGSQVLDVRAGASGGLSVNTTGVWVVAANGLTLTAAGVNVLPKDGIVANTTGLWANIGTTLAFTSGAIGVNTNLSITDLSLSGNLNVTGTLSTIDAVNLVVNDSIISLARNNGADVLDIGMYGQYNDGVERFTGLIWDTTDDTYYLFANTTTEPTTVLSIADANLRYSTLRTYLISNAFTSNATAVNITATGSTAAALTINTLSVQAQSNLAGQVANSLGFYPNSNTVGQLFGNTISRFDIVANGVTLSGTLGVAGVTTLAGQVANSLGFYPTSNTVGQLFGNTIARPDITANGIALSGTLTLSGQVANSLGFYPTSNTVGQLLGNTISRWAILANTLTTSGGASPDSNTLGTALGTNTQRWILTANSADIGPNFVANSLGAYHTATMNAATFTTTGLLANTTGIVSTSNSSGQNFGNTISRWVITANSLVTSGSVSPDSNTLGTTLGTNTQRWILTANSVATQGQLANALGIYPVSNTVGQLLGNTISRWDILTTGQSTNSVGIYPISNTVGQLLGNTISRWEITANNLALSTALPGGSGGTGQSTSTTGDLLVGGGGSAWNKLALGTAGLVLQSFGGALVYDTLDGGTF